MITATQCVLITCDDCGEDNVGDFQPHYATEAEARLLLDEWLFTDGKHYCPDCRCAHSEDE